MWIVIVNYRSAMLAADCLRSVLARHAAGRVERVFVVDNASPDDSIASLERVIRDEGWQSSVELLPMPRNGGFAFGNNAVLRRMVDPAVDGGPPRAAPAYLLLLNPDTVVEAGAVEALAEFLDAHPAAGIAGSRLLEADGSVCGSAHVFLSPLGELDAGARLGVLSRLLSRWVVTPAPREEAHACDWVSGASMMVRREVVEQIGLMDEEYFLYFEEVDYCRRAADRGWQCWCVPRSRVVHKEGSTTGIHQSDTRRPVYWFASRRRYFAKWHGASGLVAADLLWALGRASFLARRAVGLAARGPAPGPRRFLADLLLGDLRALFRGDLVRAKLRSCRLESPIS